MKRILYWIIIDGRTMEPVCTVPTRAEARELVRGTSGRIAKVEVTR